MRVLQVNSLLRGGAGRAVQRLHAGLLDAGLMSHLLTLEKPLVKLAGHRWFPTCFQNPIARRTILAAAKMKNWQYKLGRLAKPKSHEPYQYPYSAFDITLHPDYEEADLIHLHWVPGFLDFPSFFRKNKKPVVWTLHDMFPFSGGYHYEAGFPVTAYKNEIKKQLTLKKEVYASQDIHVVCLSKWMMEKSKASKTFGEFPHHLIPNGLNTDVFSYHDKKSARGDLNLPHDKVICLFVSDYLDNPRKGLTLLLKAWQKEKREDCVLLAIGKAPPELDEIPGLETFGMVKDDHRLALLYAAADIFILPSIEDNLPNTVMESLCCGCPVLAFEVGGIPDMVENNKNGLLVKDQNPDSLSKGIDIILADADKFKRSHISADAALKFNFRLQAKRMKALYESIPLNDDEGD